jgi:uncharacterized protein
MKIDRITDFHTHAFPDALAARAMKALCDGAPDAEAFHNGTIAGLLNSMDKAGIYRAVVCSIATKPTQFDPIMKWSRDILTDRIVPFASIHPNDPDALEHISQIAAAGFRGIKMHPYYQDFDLNEPRMMPLYERMAKEGLVLVMHCGYDIAFPHIRRCDPARILEVTQAFPSLKFVAAHLGGWQLWDEVEAMLVGRPVYIEISFSLELLAIDQARRIFLNHPQDRLLFGTDSPWTDQSNALRLVKNLELPENRLQHLLSLNADNLFSVQQTA